MASLLQAQSSILLSPLQPNSAGLQSGTTCAVRGIQSRERFCHEGQALKASYVVSAAENGRNGEYCAGSGLSEDPKMNPRQCDATLLDDFDVHDARRDEELRGAAWLRANIYCEEQPYTRYVDSFKKKYAEQEFSALQRRVFGQYGDLISCTCFIAVVRPSSQSKIDSNQQESGVVSGVIGTLDLSLLQGSPGYAILKQNNQYGYISNVCVQKHARQKGVASALLQAALEAAHICGLGEIYVHVHASNKPAQQLYSKKGFKVLNTGVTPELDNILLLLLQT